MTKTTAIINREKILNDEGYELAIFKDYTIDLRMRQFRRVKKSEQIDFIDMKDEEGDNILMQIKEVDPEVFMKIAKAIYNI